MRLTSLLRGTDVLGLPFVLLPFYLPLPQRTTNSTSRNRLGAVGGRFFCPFRGFRGFVKRKGGNCVFRFCSQKVVGWMCGVRACPCMPSIPIVFASLLLIFESIFFVRRRGPQRRFLALAVCDAATISRWVFFSPAFLCMWGWFFVSLRRETRP